MGHPWGAVDHLVAAGGHVVRARAVMRRPSQERWSREAVEAITAVPWDHKLAAPPGEPRALPPRPPEEAEAVPAPVDPGLVPPPAVYIYKADLERHGYTEGCRRCALIRDNHKAHGVRHTDACRVRLEAALAAADDARFRRREDKVENFFEHYRAVAEARGGISRISRTSRTV